MIKKKRCINFQKKNVTVTTHSDASEYIIMITNSRIPLYVHVHVHVHVCKYTCTFVYTCTLFLHLPINIH